MAVGHSTGGGRGALVRALVARRLLEGALDDRVSRRDRLDVAGTHLGDMSRVLVQARVLRSDGEVQELPAEALGLRYRGSSYPPGAVLLGATLRLQQGEREQIEALMHE